MTSVTNTIMVICVCSEITSSYIYMLMECGNLDLNTWLRNRKAVKPLERKFYWKNMLEAVQTIHKHGYLSLWISLLFLQRFSAKWPTKIVLISNPCMYVYLIVCAGIVHSDLKPANFVIVNASLKLIDFGIANRIQPDVTSIMKDSQVRFMLIISHALHEPLPCGVNTQQMSRQPGNACKINILYSFSWLAYTKIHVKYM